jgi:hypothetical protein
MYGPKVFWPRDNRLLSLIREKPENHSHPCRVSSDGFNLAFTIRELSSDSVYGYPDPGVDASAQPIGKMNLFYFIGISTLRANNILNPDIRRPFHPEGIRTCIRRRIVLRLRRL